jgi:sugar/nucleoside kinase (ribokinase family)
VQDKGHSLLVVGSVNMDLVMQLDRAPQGGQTLPGREYSYVPGGKGANQAVAAARLGMEVTFAGKVGADGQNRIAVFLGANMAIRKSEVAEAFTGAYEAVEAAQKLVRIVPSRYAVIKLGQRGALLYDAEQDYAKYLKGYPVQAIDSTAAGDAFTAAMTAHYLRFGDLPQAVAYANAAGALTVTRLGAQPSLPTTREVQEFIRERGLEILGV